MATSFSKVNLISGQIIVSSASEIFDPFWDNVTFMSHFDGVEGSTNIVDQSKYNHPITVLGNAHITTSNFKFGSSSLALDGSGDWLRVPYHEGFDFGEGDWTVEAWVRGEELWIGGIILARYTVSQRSWFLRLTDSIGNMAVSGNGSSTLNATLARAGLANPLEWYHVAASRNGNEIRYFLNGESSEPLTFTGSIFSAPSIDLFIGTRSDGNSPWLGQIDSVRITKGVARYTGTFVPPTNAFPTGS